MMKLRKQAKNFYHSKLQRYASVRRARSLYHAASWRLRRMAVFGRLATDRFVDGLMRTRYRLGGESSFPRRLSGDYDLQSYSDHAEASGGELHELLPAERYLLPEPTFYGGRPFGFSKPQGAISLAVPATHALSLRNAIAVGKCDLFFHDDEAVHPDQFDRVRYLLAEEASGAAKVDAKNGNIRLGIPTSVRRLSVASAVSLLGGTTHNYVHWLTEILPKLLLLDRSEALRDLPLLIDEDLHPNIRESLELFNVHRRETIEVKRHEPVHAERLVFISSPSYVPFDYRKNADGEMSTPRPADLIFTPTGIGALRELAELRIGCRPVRNRRKIYIRRSSPYRRILNLSEIEGVLAAAGFEFIEPERLRFGQQVELFSSASCIAAQGGAALGNLCFAPQGCLVIALAANSTGLNYHYFSSLAATLGQRFCFVLGDLQARGTNTTSAGDFHISPTQLAGALNYCDTARKTA